MKSYNFSKVFRFIGLVFFGGIVFLSPANAEDISKIISLNEIVYDIDNDRLEFENIIKTTDPRLLNKGFKSLLKRIFVKIFSGR